MFDYDPIDNIKTEVKQRIVEDYIYTTSDGQKYTDLIDAENHQRRLDGMRIDCPDCRGRGGYHSWGEDGYAPYRKVPCKRCRGDGFLDKIVTFQ